MTKQKGGRMHQAIAQPVMLVVCFLPSDEEAVIASTVRRSRSAPASEELWAWRDLADEIRLLAALSSPTMVAVEHLRADDFI